MTRFLDVRLSSVGGDLAAEVAIHQGTGIGNYQSSSHLEFLGSIQGRHVLIATHGFNVDRAAGIACLTNWERLLQLAQPSVFVGLLWPGDSIWLHGLEYPEAARVASDAGYLIARFLDANFESAASISLASHSLGALVMLATAAKMDRKVRRAILMAAAIDNDCLTAEFQAAAARIEEISVLASLQDQVLSAAFPVGNFFAGILAAGHPWWRAALGRAGPSRPWPSNLRAPFEIPDNWNFGHGDYLQLDPPSSFIMAPTDVPPNGSDKPGVNDWQAAWTAAFASTRFR
jgi:pimeloyl-ACP methyl ester carboxylesterase